MENNSPNLISCEHFCEGKSHSFLLLQIFLLCHNFEGYCLKESLLKNWKGRDEEEDPGKDGEKKWKEIFKC
jgi:hypothetical protein